MTLRTITASILYKKGFTNMSIIFDNEKKLFTINTKNSEYIFQLLYGKFPIHLYYGKPGGEYEEHKVNWIAFAPYYPEHGVEYTPDLCKREYAGFDNGDFRTSSIKIRNANGDMSTDLIYKSHRIFSGRLELPGLPFADAAEDTETLELTMIDELTDVEVKLYYTVYAEEDIISRYVSVTNSGSDKVVIEKLMSLLLDLPDHEYDMISLYGQHWKERHFQRHPLHYGAQNVFSRRGASSHQFNPFIALAAKDADEISGNVYGFNFVYSGSFLDEVEVDQQGFTRVQLGLGEENFSWRLAVGETFTSPEAIMTFTDSGIGQMSRNFHKFVKAHILPPEPFAQRPVVLNTWEACYMDINENVLLEFADAAVDVGIDMIVMDDGWFGERHEDNAGLGDWYENKKKFPEGLKAFVDKIKSRGIKFGIWIEPEMVNPDSDLYRAHPDWCLHCKGRTRLESRQQLVLDMGNPEVVEYLKNSFKKTFDGVAIDYFKWDANRHLSPVGSAILEPECQGEAAYRFMLGSYELFRWLKETYPNAMLENCSGGGGRYDLGMMKYSTMIWTSDNTVPSYRIGIQHSSMLAYPAATMSCHISNHHNICNDPRQLKYRFEVALGGALGYEFHLPHANEEVKATIREQIKTYRKYEKLILDGEYYPVANPFEKNYSAYYYTTEGRDKFLLSFLQFSPEENAREITIPVLEANENAIYLEEFSGKSYTGRELRSGIKVMTDNTDCNSTMWSFILQ